MGKTDLFALMLIVVFGVKQKLKTRVVKKNVNPEWEEDLTLSIADPNTPIKLVSVLLIICVLQYLATSKESRSNA